jgi:hypothetical protein
LKETIHMDRIQQAKRENEKYVLNKFRKSPTADTCFFSVPLYNALDRLIKGGMIAIRPWSRRQPGAHIVRKYARPVTR